MMVADSYTKHNKASIQGQGFTMIRTPREGTYRSIIALATCFMSVSQSLSTQVYADTASANSDPFSEVRADPEKEIVRTIIKPQDGQWTGAGARPLLPRACGTAWVVVTVRADGTVADPKIWRSSKQPELDVAALSQVAEWQFKPARIANSPVPSHGLILMTSEWGAGSECMRAIPDRQDIVQADEADLHIFEQWQQQELNADAHQIAVANFSAEAQATNRPYLRNIKPGLTNVQAAVLAYELFENAIHCGESTYTVNEGRVTQEKNVTYHVSRHRQPTDMEWQEGLDWDGEVIDEFTNSRDRCYSNCEDEPRGYTWSRWKGAPARAMAVNSAKFGTLLFARHGARVYKEKGKWQVEVAANYSDTTWLSCAVAESDDPRSALNGSRLSVALPASTRLPAAIKAITRVGGSPPRDFFDMKGIKLPQHLGGRVGLNVCVNADGTLSQPPTAPEPDHYAPALTEVALQMAQSASGRYRPPTEDGVAVAGCFRFNVSFN